MSFGYDLSVQEMSKYGCDGELDDITSEANVHGSRSVDLWRLILFVVRSEDGAIKSIIVSGTSICNHAKTI